MHIPMSVSIVNMVGMPAKAPIRYIPKHIPVSIAKKVNVSTRIIQCFLTTIKSSSFVSRVMPTHSRIFWFAFSLVGMRDSFESNIWIFCVHRFYTFMRFIQRKMGYNFCIVMSCFYGISLVLEVNWCERRVVSFREICNKLENCVAFFVIPEKYFFFCDAGDPWEWSVLE